jgi:hypothetical protein
MVEGVLVMAGVCADLGLAQDLYNYSLNLDVLRLDIVSS